MPELLNQYWIVLAIAAVLVAVALFLFVPRRDPRPPAIGSEAPRKPLEPRKPDIVAAPRNRFDATPAAQAEPVPEPLLEPLSESLSKSAPSIAATPPPQAPPAAVEPEAQAASDDLSMMKGVGPKLVAKLNALGIARYRQIAAWNETDIDAIDEQLGPFKGRIRRDDWVEQARLLAAGDTAGFEARFGALG